MKREDIFDVAEDIFKGLYDAADSKNFTDLGNEIKKAVDVAKDVTKNVTQSMTSSTRAVKKDYYFSKHVNKSLGIVRVVFGIYFLAIGAMLGLASLLPFSSREDIIFSLVTMAIHLAIGAGLFYSGKKARKLIKNYLEYGRIVGEREYITVRELSDRTAQSEATVVNNIKNILANGFIPSAALDKENSTLMLTRDVYAKYYELQKSKEKESNDSTENDKYHRNYYTIDDSLPEDVKVILKEGNEYLNKIRYYNDLIPDDEAMSDKLYTLEATVLSIFKKLQDEPSAAGDLRKLMSYYLPTTEKLLQSYVDLRNHPDTVENIRKSQIEIEEATDVINDAFVNLLNQLFQSDVWDISSDISVMKTMMKQDSLL